MVGTFKDDKIKVLHLIDQYRTGGPGKTIMNTAKYIDHVRFEVHVGLFFSEESPNSEFVDRIRKEGIPHLLLADKRGINLFNLRKLTIYIRKEGDQNHSYAWV